jgi:hypothetical protein
MQKLMKKLTLPCNPSENTALLPTNKRKSVTFQVTGAYGSNLYP